MYSLSTFPCRLDYETEAEYDDAVEAYYAAESDDEDWYHDNR